MNSEKFWDRMFDLIPLFAILGAVIVMIGTAYVIASIEHIPVGAIYGNYQPYCFLSHNGTVDYLSENDKFTYREPTQICDINGMKNYTGSLIFTNENRTMIQVSYSYGYQMNFIQM